MAKRKRKSLRVSKECSRRHRLRLLIPGLLGLAVVAAPALWFFVPQKSAFSGVAHYQGGPRLAVDKELIDFGEFRFGRMADASFHLRNVGDQPLRLAMKSPVEAVQGC